MSELEGRFGDPWDPANPVSHAAVLAADERNEMSAEGERLLDDYGLNAEFVPVEYGGRFSRLDRLIQVMRTVFRHDPCLGLGYGASSFIAAVNVWTSGDQAQCRHLADLLLAHRKVASVYHELAHGNDFASAEMSAWPGPAGGLVLNGHKEVITNVRRADALVIFARTSADAGSRSHSQLFVDATDLPKDRVRHLPRFGSSGMRGVQLGGIEFTDCPIDDGAVLGSLGLGMETALRSFQLTRTALPAMATGILDTGLRVTMRFAEERRLYGRPVADIPQVRAVLADAFTDLLICDSLSTVVARSVHLLPEETILHASVAKYLIATRLMAAMRRLSQILGSRFYIREGPYAIFQKLFRDLAPAGFGHAARVACLGTVLPQLPRLARRSWPHPGEPVTGVFHLDGPLPPLPFGELAARSDGRDSLAAALVTAVRDPATEPELRELGAIFVGELAELTRECAALAPRDLTVGASAEALALPARYANVIAASACVNIWRHTTDTGSFLADPTWVIAALRRLARTPTAGRPVAERLFAEVRARGAGGRGFDLSNRHLHR